MLCRIVFEKSLGVYPVGRRNMLQVICQTKKMPERRPVGLLYPSKKVFSPFLPHTCISENITITETPIRNSNYRTLFCFFYIIQTERKILALKATRLKLGGNYTALGGKSVFPGTFDVSEHQASIAFDKTYYRLNSRIATLRSKQRNTCFYLHLKPCAAQKNADVSYVM